MKLTAEWSSVTYSGIKGTCTFDVVPIDNNFKVTCVFNYDADSKFRPGVSKTLEMTGILVDQRINIQTDINSSCSLMITIAFDKPIMNGFYASIQPIDCGVIKLIGTKQYCKSVFDIK